MLFIIIKFIITLGQIIDENKTINSIDLSNNTKGIYFIKLNIENQSKSFKIILN